MSELVDRVAVDSVLPMQRFVAEAAHRDSQATDAVFLTFNADLAFLESRLLGLCRQAGARVTVIADASVWAPDVRSVTLAGIRYHVGLVAAGGAFHPKLSLIVGAKRAVAIVGSGNLGIAGWQHNAELASVLTGDLEAAPRALADLADILGTLAARPELDPTSADSLHRAADRLHNLLDNTARIVDTGHRLIASWDGPLIDRLPTGPVDELLLTAAFHDPDSAAVKALLERLQPAHTQIALQEGTTVVDPAALNRVVTDYTGPGGATVTVVADPETARYRHGKLIEWVADGQRMALTGSANLSRAALLSTPPRGNFEIGVIAAIEHSLFPGGNVIEQLEQVPMRTWKTPGVMDGNSGPVPTSAVLGGGSVTLRFARLNRDVDVECSRYQEPDVWQHLASAAAGERTIVVPCDLHGGDRVRLAWTDTSGTPHQSPAIFVTQPSTAQRRPEEIRKASRLRDTAPSDLWGEDLSFLDSVLGDLAALAEELAGNQRPPSDRAPAPASTPNTRTTSPRPVEAWLWLRNDAMDRLGPGLGPYMFGLPPLPPGRREATPDWVDDAGSEADTDIVPEVDQEQTEAEPEESVTAAASVADADHARSPLAIRKARRKWSKRAAEISATLPMQYRLLLLRLVLRLWSLNNWDEGDTEPLQLVSTLTRSLALPNQPADSELEPELATRVGSLAAIAATFVQHHIDPGVFDKATLAYQELRRDINHLLPDASDDVMTAYLEGLVGPAEADLWLYDAHEMALDVAEGDMLGDMERDLEIAPTTVTVARPGMRLLHLIADVPQQRVGRLALELSGRAEDQPSVGIWVSNLQQDWALVVWRRPDLVRVTSKPNGRQRWRHQALGGLVGPQGLADQEARGQNPTHYDVSPRGRPTAAGVAVLAALGINDPVPPIAGYARFQAFSEKG